MSRTELRYNMRTYLLSLPAVLIAPRLTCLPPPPAKHRAHAVGLGLFYAGDHNYLFAAAGAPLQIALGRRLSP